MRGAYTVIRQMLPPPATSGTTTHVSNRLRVPTYIFLTLLFLASTLPAYGNDAAVTWYSGGEGKLRLTPIPNDNSSSIVLIGKTSQKTLLVTVTKKNGPQRTNPIPLAPDGSFNVRYLIKDGIGTYTITFSSSEQSSSLRYQGIGFVTHLVKSVLPTDMRNLELNDKIIEYVSSVMGTTVGRGECWDLAQEVLDRNLAEWSRPTNFGRLLNPEIDEIKPGDIIQFRSLKITERLPGGVTKWLTLGAPDHTAIVYTVQGKKRYSVAHQNVSGMRRVITADVDLTKVTGGTFRIYRPVALMIQQ